MSDPLGRLSVLSDHDLWEEYRARGLSVDDATRHVELRRTAVQEPELGRQETTAAQDMGPLWTVLQAGGETVGSLPKMVGQLATPIATHIVQSLHTSPEGKAEAGRAGQDIYNLFGKLDPANALTDEERRSVATSQAENPLATDIGTVGAIFGPPAVLGASKLIGSRMEGAALKRRMLTAETDMAEERLNAMRRGIGEQLGGIAPTSPAPVEPSVARDWQPPIEPLNAETQQAIRDFEAGKITGEDLRYQMDVGAGRTPSRVAPTVPQAPPRASSAPRGPPVVPPAAVPPAGASAPARVTEGLPLPGSPKGMTALGPPTPPAPTAPTVTEILVGKRGTVPYYPRGGAAEQARAPLPIKSGLPTPARMVTASQPLAEALGQAPKLEPFTGAGFTGASRVMQSPLYQQASSLARQFLKDPSLTAQFPELAGMDEAGLTKALRTLMMEQGQGGASAPALTSLPKFLQRLKPAVAR